MARASARFPAVEHFGKAARDPVGRVEHGALGEMRIAEGGRDVGMAEQPRDDAQAAAVDPDRRGECLLFRFRN